jgi:hypothetical protein
MFDLYIRFKTTSNLLIFLPLALTNTLWIYRRLKRRQHVSLTPFILINVLLFITLAGIIGIHADENEHLHCVWMVSQGLVPFKDFWQHHSPFLWVILAPLFNMLKPTALIFVISRIFSAFIFMVIIFLGWQIAKSVLQEKANASMYLFVLFSAGILGEFLMIRPDLFMDIFLLLGIYFSLEIPGKRLLFPFFAGISFALAASFTFKQYLLYLLPIIIIFLERNKLSIAKFLAYLFGLVVGSLPLLLYLIKKNILNEFIFWSFKFNRGRLVPSVILPIAIGFMGVWGAYQMLRRYHKFKNIKSLILFIAFCLSTISSLTGSTLPSGLYYLGFWFIFCAILSSGCNILEISEKVSSLAKKSILLGLLFSLLLAPNFMYAGVYNKSYFSEDKKVIAKLMEYSIGDTCLVILHLHPIFSYDATRLYSYFQYTYINEFTSMRKDLKSKDIAEGIINLKPAVILYKFNNRFFFLDLLQKGLISKADYKNLIVFLQEYYKLQSIGKNEYCIRNDKLENRQ